MHVPLEGADLESLLVVTGALDGQEDGGVATAGGLHVSRYDKIMIVLQSRRPNGQPEPTNGELVRRQASIGEAKADKLQPHTIPQEA